MSEADRQVTEILRAAAAGDREAADELMPLVYDALRRMAHKQMARREGAQTLQPTALVHEAYLRLFGREEPSWRDRGHFFATAALAMRQILVDRARRRGAQKRGGDRARVSLEQVDRAHDELPPEQFLALDAALERLEGVDGEKARVVMLRYFAGLTIEQTAHSLGISPATVKRDWQFAKAWLYREMTRDDAQRR